MSLSERFAAFFAAANMGSPPYPWQVELVKRVAASGRWPTSISAPTGSGKSAVIDAHVFLVAEHAAGRIGARPPRRLVLVAPRRVLVDDQHDRASRLARLLGQDQGENPALDECAQALSHLRTSCPGDGPDGPLAVWRLRGGVALDNGWRLEPAACQVLCATPEMWGSRLLFRGYGASRASRNLEAGLLAHDVVAVVDEAHLHRRLVETARAVAGQAVSALGLQVVSMSATQTHDGDDIGLAKDDYDDVALARRVQATKAIETISVGPSRPDVEAAILRSAREVRVAGTVGVFVNDVPMALSVAAGLQSDGATVELVCGRLRRADLDRLRARRPGLLTAEGDPEVDYLVSTQSLEVGVDLDLPHLVTAIAPASVLAQRAGRLNRSGRLSESALTVVVPEPTDGRGPVDGPYASTDLASGSAWLESLNGSISPEVVSNSDLPLPERPLLPKLRQVDLETLAMTSAPQAADPDIRLYIEDPEQPRPDVGIIARRHLDLPADVLEEALVACPPRAHEIAQLSYGGALDRLVRAAGFAWWVRFEDGQTVAGRLDDLSDLRPGDVVVVPDGAPICTAGVVGLSEGPGPRGALDDVLEESVDGVAADRIVRLDAAELAPIIAGDRYLAGRAGREALALVVDETGDEHLANSLRRHRRLSDLELVWCGGTGDAAAGLLVVRDMAARAVQVPLATPSTRVTVEDHQTAVEARMRLMIEALRCDVAADRGKQLSVAARTHDDGKRHPRFQRRMGADNAEALAKPLPGHVPDRGDGWRHEQLSAAYAAHAADGDPLVISMVGAHHGRGRTLFDRDGTELVGDWDECPAAVREWVERLFGVGGRYERARAVAQRSLGIHGLAWYEALLRGADMQVSREGG